MSETPEALKLKIARLEGEIQTLVESNTKLSQDNADLNKEIGSLNNQVRLEKEKNDQIIVPLSIRHMAVSIEQQCPIASFTIPANSPYVPTDDFSQNDIYRTYKFRKILNNTIYSSQNLFVARLNEALENEFKKTKGLNAMRPHSADFQTYKLQFCYSIITAVKAANKLQAHIINVGKKRTLLGLYSPPIDEFCLIFYNALLGSGVANE